jgi:hypothetical protein
VKIPNDARYPSDPLARPQHRSSMAHRDRLQVLPGRGATCPEYEQRSPAEGVSVPDAASDSRQQGHWTPGVGQEVSRDYTGHNPDDVRLGKRVDPETVEKPPVQMTVE